MVADPADLVLDRVGERLRSLSPTPSQFSIFRVPSQLRKINETTYEPEMLAIGPYHGLNRSLSDYIMTMRALEEKARNCYEGSISLYKEENLRQELREYNGRIFKLGWILPFAVRGMLLVENKLLFFVLWELFSMTEIKDPIILDYKIQQQKAGIKFQKVEDCFLFDINFENGGIKIPTLEIGDTTKVVLNLIAYE
ncbi:hypothetical protein CISIN_1g046629mg [Citrus sinensis]|uniref:Uncharacterized protein n=1 Tax=Citrus sinensis TaxID=2711 RepID=A0A067DKT1_CITSI|nr:hypothetical protein CISIN_1g046629mg [Citrus sinensis]